MLGVLFGDKKQRPNKIFNDFTSIDLDAVLDEQHEWKNEVTQNPVETGAPITDHVIEHADKLKIHGTVTNHPMKSVLDTAKDIYNGVKTVPRLQTTFDALRELHEAQELVTVYTRYKIYQNMMIESISIPRNSKIGEEIQFTMELVKVRFASTQLVDLPDGINPNKKKSTVGKKTDPQKDKGKTEAKSTPSTSILSNIFK